MSSYTEILEEARKKIESGEEHFICTAIGPSIYWGSERFKIKKWIGRLLNHINNYENWLFQHHYEFFCWMGRDDFRAGRLQWLDWMIANVDREISK